MSMQPLRVGIIGCGNIGSGSHLPAWLEQPDLAQVVALADPTEASLNASATVAGLADDRLHTEPTELIARADVHAIDICTPQHLRRDLIVQAAAEGKHILCEKPLATAPADAAIALEAVAKSSATLAMVHNYLWLPEIQAAQRVIDSGEIGTVRAVTVNYLGIVDVPGNPGYAPRWRHDAALAGGGVLMDILHGVYVAESLLGEPLQRASGYADNADPDANVEDIAMCRFETSKNAALVNIGWGFGPGGIEVIGTAGRISAIYEDGGTPPWSPLERVTVTTVAGTRTELDATASGQDGLETLKATFKHVVRDFAEAALYEKQPRASGVDGQRILEATVGALKSAVSGQVVEIPLEQNDPVFRQGVLGVADLDLPEWSPARRRSLYRHVARAQ